MWARSGKGTGVRVAMCRGGTPVAFFSDQPHAGGQGTRESPRCAQLKKVTLPSHPHLRLRPVRATVSPRQAVPSPKARERHGQQLSPDVRGWHTFLLASPEHLTTNVHVRPLAWLWLFGAQKQTRVTARPLLGTCSEQHESNWLLC